MENQPTTIQPSPAKEKKSAAAAKPERIRAELNIEKWPAIWNPTHSKTRSQVPAGPRSLERETTAADGSKTVSKVTINPIAHLGDLTTDDQRTLYALIKHWEDRGKPAHETPFSIRQLSRLLHKKGWGTNVIESVTGSLERLRGTMLVWTRSYRSKDQRMEDMETVYVNILTKLKIIRRKVDGHITTEAGYFQFDDHILKNLLENYTKPFLFEVFIDIKGEIALKLYSYLDLIMADKTRFERCTLDLFDDLGLRGASYRNPSKRKQNLEKAFAELTSIMLTTGVLKSATIEKTKDGRDYKAVFVKTTRSALLSAEFEPSTKFIDPPAVVINDYSKPKDRAVVEAEELVKYFYKLFHGVDNHSPLSKETSQALTLTSQYGLEKAKFVAEFAREEAAKTNFQIQHFGGILSYASRALAAFGRGTAAADRQAGSPKIQPARPMPRAEQETFERGEQRFNLLTEADQQARLERAKAELLKENTYLARWKDGRDLHLGVIRRWVIRQLDQECMELVVLESSTDPDAICQKLGLQNLGR